ncbi:hypothetical protein P9B03_15015 [Metasolibacillus meyeri]|uniref:Uncharacterized protein n=1 Tax=Metasolibacillus meyeri TaxID=1071052 RepID=A0AAW9NXD9_9BACL|nr:hypothetical protein [Metasolibacillus meyeri]MEC1179808.1 hypothetical protein [Metasolibacillus meyeri]
MPYFTWRISVLLLLITLFLIHAKMSSGAFLISAGVLTLYFFTPILKKGHAVSYSCMILLLFSSAFLSVNMAYVLPVVAYFLMDSALLLKVRSHVGLLGISMLGMVALVAIQQLALHEALFVIIIMCMAVFLRHYVQATREKQILPRINGQ